MNIIVVGDGKVGLAITIELSKEGHNLTVIDSNYNVLERNEGQSDVMVVHGNGAALPVLREADAQNADILIAATSADEINILTCIMAKRIGAKRTIARVRNPEYSEQLIMLRDELGLSMTINPELAAAGEINNIMQFPSFLRRDKFAKGRVEIVELKVKPGSILKDIALKNLYKTVDVKVLICAVERKGQAYIPNGDFIIREGDRIYVTAASSNLVKLVESLKIESRKTRNVMIIGGSRIAYYLSVMLIKSGIDVKIIEKDHERCIQLADMLPKATIIEGSGNSQQLLLEEGIKETDALVTLTDIDEENIFLSMYGKYIGVYKTITKINQMEYADVIEDMGIDSVVSPKMLCATEIVRYVRAMSDTQGGSVITMYDLVNGKAEALEFKATANTRYLDMPLADVPIRNNFLIACITRRDRPIIPKGSDVIQEGDTIIVVTNSEKVIVDLNEIFHG